MISGSPVKVRQNGCQDGNTSSRTITALKHLELNQFPVGYNLLESDACYCRAIVAYSQYDCSGRREIWPLRLTPESSRPKKSV